MGRATGTALSLVAAGLALVVAACGGTTAGDEKAASQPAKTATAGSEQKSGNDVKVRVVTVTPTNAGTWDPAQKAAYDAVFKANGWNSQVAEAVPYGKADQLFRQWGNDGVDVVFSTDNGFEDSLMAAAKKFPKTAWVMMSGLSSTQGLP